MERADSFASFAKVREPILDIRAQSDSTAHPVVSGKWLVVRGQRAAPQGTERRTVNGETANGER